MFFLFQLGDFYVNQRFIFLLAAKNHTEIIWNLELGGGFEISGVLISNGMITPINGQK